MMKVLCTPARVIATVAVALAACMPPDSAPGTADPGLGRPADGLLVRPELQQLVEYQVRRDAASLVAALEDPDPVVRARAAFALGSVQDTTAAPALLQALQDLDPRVRADAAFAVGQLPVNGVATPLFNALKMEWDSAARAQQLEGVGKRCEEGAARRLFQIDEAALAPGVARAMARCVLADVAPDTLWTRLAVDLVHRDPEVRAWAAYAFGRHPDPEVWIRHRPAVRDALRSYEADDPAAMHLIRALSRTLDRFSLQFMGWWLRNGALWQTRANAAAAMGEFEFMGALRLAAEGLDDPSIHVRLNALQVVTGVPPSPPLIQLLERVLRENAGDVAMAAEVLPVLAAAGRGEALDAWFNRPDILEERVLLAGVAGAAVLEGSRGVELLGFAAMAGPPRAARTAVDELQARWEVSRPFPQTHPVFRRTFTDLASAPDRVVRSRAMASLQDSVFQEAGVGEGPPTAEGSEAAGSGGSATRRPRAVRAVDWDRLRSLGSQPRLHLLTNRGTVVLELRPEEAPLTVDAIAATAEAGLFDGVPFHRVVPNFVVQGGDVSRSGTRPGVDFVLRSEFTRVPFSRGVVGMASAGKDTETTQFFITHSPQPHLDGGYTAFGTVVQGMEVVDALAPEDPVVRAWVTPGGA